MSERKGIACGYVTCLAKHIIYMFFMGLPNICVVDSNMSTPKKHQHRTQWTQCSRRIYRANKMSQLASRYHTGTRLVYRLGKGWTCCVSRTVYKRQGSTDPTKTWEHPLQNARNLRISGRKGTTQCGMSFLLHVFDVVCPLHKWILYPMWYHEVVDPWDTSFDLCIHQWDQFL